MSLPVVRCPACGGASRVPPDAIGLMVACPRCQAPFVAREEEAAPAPTRSARPTASPVRAPAARRAPGQAEPKPRPAAAIPIAPPRLDPADGPPPTEAPDPEHDPHTPVPGGLPFSVLVGFALMPFAIPLLWLLGPLVTGFEPALSLAVPVSLAVAAAALCLGVVYTIDWSAVTRIKGVLMLVCLAYLSAAGLYFLKKDLMDRVQRFFAVASEWDAVDLPDSRCSVRMPGRPQPVRRAPLAGVEWAEGKLVVPQASERGAARRYEYFAAASKSQAPPVPADDRWFADVGRQVQDAARGAAVEGRAAGDARPHRQWVLTLPSGAVRIVRVYAVDGRVYYLAVEGPNLQPDDEHAAPFLGSFVLADAD